MGILDSIKTMGRGIARLPGAINEARYNHATVMVPIGRNPDTGEEITIPAEELQSMDAMYDPASGQIMRPQTVRTGQSGFGNFLANGLPRMLDAGIAAATAPGNGQGGFLAGLRGMDIGRDRLEKRDMLAYQMQRQRINDEALDQQRRTQADENRAQAEMYRRRMNQEPPDPLAGLKARAAAANLIEGTPEYQEFMVTNGNPRPKDRVPTLQTGEQMLLWEWQNEKDPARKEKLRGEILKWRTNQQAPVRLQHRTEWRAIPNSQDEEAFSLVFNPITGETEVKPVEGSRRPRRQPNPTRPSAGRQMTPAQAQQQQALAAANRLMQEAGQDFDKALALARTHNAPLEVQNILLDGKKKATPPAPRGGGGGKKSDIPAWGPSAGGAGASGAGGWRSEKSKILGGK